VTFIRHFLLAVQFFTRIPITGRLAAWVGYSPEMLRRSAAHFAGVGWIVGLVAASVYAAVMVVTQNVFAPLVAACLSTIATVMLTGGFHEDGLADVADGLGGSYERERALEIMKDSRVGAFGAMALVLALVTKVSLLAAMGAQAVAPAAGAYDMHGLLLMCVLMLCAHVVSRAAPMLLVWALPHVGDTATSKSKPLADKINTGALLANFLWCFMLLVPVIPAQAAMVFIVGLIGSILALAWMYRLFKRRLQGFTGDCLGATQQVCELAFYGAALVVLPTVAR
jgi:adenosylcobinamide-GDP ribazoletransferase